MKERKQIRLRTHNSGVGGSCPPSAIPSSFISRSQISRSKPRTHSRVFNLNALVSIKKPLGEERLEMQAKTKKGLVMDMQLGLYLTDSKLPDICRNNHGGNEFSEEANASLQNTKKIIRKTILDYIRGCGEHGATCEEIEIALTIPHQSCSARCTELKNLKLVYQDGGRLTRSKRRAAVLKAVEHRA